MSEFRKVFLYLLGVLVSGFFLIVLWMNLTPGHFEIKNKFCCCVYEELVYYKEFEEDICAVADCSPAFRCSKERRASNIERLLAETLSLFDFYR